MSDNSVTKEKNTTKTVEIPVFIKTEYERDPESPEYVGIQIEQIRFQIGAVAYFMREAARGHSLLDLCSDTVLLDLSEFLENVQLGCQLIEGLSEALDLPNCRQYILSGIAAEAKTEVANATK